MAGPGAKGAMWRNNGKGKRVLITRKMARQMAAAGMSAETDAEYAAQASKLRERNNADAKAKRKADVESRTIKDDNQPSTDKNKWAKEPPEYFLVDRENIKGIKSSKGSSKDIKLIQEAGIPKNIPIVLKEEGRRANTIPDFTAMNANDPTLRALKSMTAKQAENFPVFVANKSDIQKIKRQQAILKEIDELKTPDLAGSKALFSQKNRLEKLTNNKDGINKRSQYYLNDVDEFTNKSRKFSAKENKLIDKLSNSIRFYSTYYAKMLVV